jgi:predicted RNA-binding Zn-ribbon protein involved in translation (DUF1610 family)
MAFKLKCPNCGNTKRFNISVVEYHDHVVNGAGEFIEDAGCEDAEDGSQYYCNKCGELAKKERK